MYVDGENFVIEDSWRELGVAHRVLTRPCSGATIFTARKEIWAEMPRAAPRCATVLLSWVILICYNIHTNWFSARPTWVVDPQVCAAHSGG